MAKVDTSKIEGYADMSVEDKLSALEAYEFETHPDRSGEIEQLKSTISKANAENAEWKKKYNSRLSEEEAKAAQDAEERESIMKELESLRKDKAISSHKSSYLALGYDEEMAEANAKALHAGDYTTVFANQKKFIDSQRKAAAASALDSQPDLSKGEPMSGQNAADTFTATMRKFAGLPTK